MARASPDLQLRCRCSHVRGVASEVSPSSGFRFVCYCNDCQAFARFLDRADVLDAAGGTDIFQLPPGRVKLTAGADAVCCLRFSGKVFRWYADCCRTPIANTAATPRFPVLGLIHSFMSDEAEGRSPRRGYWSAAVPNLRTLSHRSAPAERASAAVVRDLRPPRIEDARLVAARARPAEPVLRRSYQRAALRAARAHAERARRALNGLEEPLAANAAALDRLSCVPADSLRPGAA